MRLYAITDRRLLAGPHSPGILTDEERAGLVQMAGEWAALGVEYVQLREKDLKGPALTMLVTEMAAAIRQAAGARRPQLLLNAGSPDAWEVARLPGVDGLHLPGKWSPEQVGRARIRCLVSVGCHSVEEVAVAGVAGADLALLSPIFPTESHPEARPLGLELLDQAVHAAGEMPVFALGGVDEAKAAACLARGAAGVAGIRTFLSGRWTSHTERAS